MSNGCQCSLLPIACKSGTWSDLTELGMEAVVFLGSLRVRMNLKRVAMIWIHATQWVFLLVVTSGRFLNRSSEVVISPRCGSHHMCFSCLNGWGC